ncbi:MAG: hypothetical protein COW18_10155 [Zetaproteobacteria bacterium CG12_big_fil_rev_8_21_14_0_65_54_13]|nr:MAG: hypothetical protein COW18_10155 [Zetaproteobacteria bacterium CG12_big_fil_rev_8_21_14_0_65_54_13]PIX55887.1 MAG: hypothetical protein COZ50_00465 [Zetaproteobacteria bacterium CG_4_10_14_3_um_filter_54_28]PJA28740.1 MAG: hypothetical protein CO188_08540 [Zetaproteobacteria bacterium CG_4_9_14_3_um_filter_54_145]
MPDFRWMASSRLSPVARLPPAIDGRLKRESSDPAQLKNKRIGHIAMHHPEYIIARLQAIASHR